MEQRDYYILLFDYYSVLFSNKQKAYFEDYYFNNLSLSEMSENIGVSRNAIHKSIKLIEKKLVDYEEKIGLYEKSKKLEIIIEKIDDDKIKKDLEGLL